MQWLTNLVETPALIHLVGLVGLIVLVALGTVSVAVGLPLITGLTGLAIPTASSIIAATKRLSPPSPALSVAKVVPQ
jgi:hypothetical protein